ncbi:MAG TPA: CcmD family protein [Chitinophagaceae bacterium]|nr:CcmD family protein [Chitinophagaceae bacterium]HMZ47252.1 CcmD family protein [Chitinophagaceae bacterium]HNF29713.1 CcmD family protein [Chitinophagaceae bacterium]HNJ58165.1 CcmD family protein [Chitinophagaceae bacterium]HNM34414.1 CcmD family protein [Chitinophagaceae bacterium]
MGRIKLIASLCIILFSCYVVNAQELITEESRKAARNEQSIYIVMAVVLTLMLGIFLYLFNLDKKLSKLEKEG